MDVNQVEGRITTKTKAILVVHIYGLPARMDDILELAKKYNLKVIEDAAEMHGQTYKGKKCGAFGDISIFSFYPNKQITTGEGGMILANDVNLAARCRKLRNLAFEADGPRFIHYEIGWNYRMTNMQAALGLAQLEQIDEFIIKKRETGHFYNESLQRLIRYNFQLPLATTDYADNIYWVYGLVAPDTNEKTRLTEHLKKKMIGYRPFFWSMHKQPVFHNMKLFLDETYPVAERLSETGIYLPSGLGLSHEDLEVVSKTIREIYE
jgi:perosamine synthetase